MNLVKRFEQYNNDNLIFCEPIKNNIMNDGIFIRTLYSTSTMTLNGVYLLVNLYDITTEIYYNKYKCIFNVLNNKTAVDYLKIIEEEILKKYITNKIPLYKINDQMKCGYIKIFTDVGNVSHCSFVIKISGIWENNRNYGLTYKFVKID